MTDEWGFYPCQMDGRPASIYLDMGIAQLAPIPDFDKAVCLRLWMNRPRPDGLSSQEEYETLVAIEDALKAEVEQNSPAIYVGRNTSGGCRDFFFYTSDEHALRAAASATMSHFADYRTEIDVWADEGWGVYFNILYPDDDQKQVMGNHDVILALRRQGDDCRAPRKIDHLIVAADREQAETLARTVVDRGFNLKSGGPAKRPGGRWSVEFDKIEAPLDLNETTIMLARLAKEYGGDYDGWGCEVVKP